MRHRELGLRVARGQEQRCLPNHGSDRQHVAHTVVEVGSADCDGSGDSSGSHSPQPPTIRVAGLPQAACDATINQRASLGLQLSTPARNQRHFPSAFAATVCGRRSSVAKLSLERRLHGHDGCVNAVHWDDSGRWLVSGSDDTLIKVWEARPRPRQVLSIDSGHQGNIFR